ncbi:MAG TPA: hypothetical protein VF868_09285 [Bacteroidia bacterium]|jgi:hypothetical protein
MKHLFFATALFLNIFLATPLAAGANPNTDSADTICLEVNGIALDTRNLPIDGAQIRLYKENDELEWSEITSAIHHEHHFQFKLEVNSHYTIEISKPGFITRLVSISTIIPPHVSLEQIFKYEFDVQLLSSEEKLNDYYIDFPVALISYDSKRDVFDNNYTYTKHIKTMMKSGPAEKQGNALTTKR